MDRNLDEAQFVLMVCTETYRRRVMGREEPGKSLGVLWEGSLIYNRIYHDKPSGSRFIPILLLAGSESAHIPNPVQGHTYYRLTTFDFTDSGYEALYRHLTDQPATPRPDLGPIKRLPPKLRPQPSPGPLPPEGGPMTNVRGNVVGSAVVAGNTVNVQAPPYVAKVSGKRKDGQDFYGTGFILPGDGLVATCGDVIEDAAEPIFVKLPTQEEPWLCHVKEQNKNKDLALLRADVPVKPSSASVADLDPLWVQGVHDNVRDKDITCHCWGYSNLDSPDDPQRINGNFSHSDPSHALIYLDLDATVNQGDSGAPVLNANNKVIGLVNYRQTKRIGLRGG